MKNIIFPDYSRSLLNITSTILDYYGVPTKHPVLPELKEILNKRNYRNVVYLLVDAMGAEILKYHQSQACCLLSNQIETLTTVFPSTTVSATTSVLTGESPMTTGWLGWLQYFKEVKRSMILFLNTDFYDADFKIDYHVSEKYLPIQKIYEKIEKASPDVTTKEIFPEFRNPEHKTFRDLINSVITLTKNDGRHFIYAYWDKLDTYLHKYGTTSLKVKQHIEEIDHDLVYLQEQIEGDTLVIVTADHGQLDIEEIELWSYQDIIDTFEHDPSIEARATAFFIREGMKERFQTLFTEHFGDAFMLLTSEEFLATGLLGPGPQQARVKEFLGDFMAIAIDRFSFKLSHSKRAFKAQHAGLTKEEMLIPLIVLNQQKK